MKNVNNERELGMRVYIYIYVIIWDEKFAGIIIVKLKYNDVRVPERRNMSTIKDEVALYQNLKNLSSTNIYIYISIHIMITIYWNKIKSDNKSTTNIK